MVLVSELLDFRKAFLSVNRAIATYTGAPNGWKASILAQELDIPCKVKPISLYDGEQKQPWFLGINPNGRVPAIGVSIPSTSEPYITVQIPGSSNVDVVVASGSAMLGLFFDLIHTSTSYLLGSCSR